MRITVLAKPKAREEKVEPLGDNQFRVSVKEPPVEGRANAAIIRAVAEYFGVSAASVSIISGHASRTKVIEVERL